jgi:uncharacterized protein YjbI with pentapeptide repeats
MAKIKHIDIINQGVAIWNQWRKDHPNIRPDLEDALLTEMDLSAANLRRANLKGANLKKANLYNAILNEAILTNADLSQANATLASMIDATLNHADLQGANLSHVSFLRSSLICANLKGATLYDAGLRDTNLNSAILTGADMDQADARSANLTKADLNGATLKGTDLENATLINANLSNTKCNTTNFRSANLSNAELQRADLWGAYLNNSDMSNAVIGFTRFGRNDLSTIRGLDSVLHRGPSSIDIDTIYFSEGKISEYFLREAGVPDTFVTFMSSLTQEAIQYFSCFLSHAGPDAEFADRLRNDLVSNNVSCWHYRYDMRGGQFWRTQISEAIKIHEKLILVCSKQALLTRNVVDEIVAALERERETHSQKLFPIRLDDFILGNEMLKTADKKMKAGEWREDWVRQVRAYHIPDFRKWKKHDAYQPEFYRLLDALRNPARR